MAVFAAASLASMVPWDAEAETYRLVESRFVASELENARLFVHRHDRIKRTGLLSVGLVGGVRDLGLDELNQELSSNGYSTVGTRETIGLIGAVDLPKLHFALYFGGGPGEIADSAGADGNVGLSTFEVEMGPNLYRDDAVYAAPVVGLGVGQLNVLARTTDPGHVPFGERDASELKNGFDVYKNIAVMNLGVLAQSQVPLSSEAKSRHGLALGVQVGYAIMLGQSRWMVGSDGTMDGPSANVSGPYVRLSLGYGWDNFDVKVVEVPLDNCTGELCQVACREGYANCDGNLRNGCETPLGTVHHCGHCGDDCSPEHGHGVCAERHYCALSSCEFGFANCNGRLHDGCEVSLAEDDQHCGACGRACTAGRACRDGRCAPRKPEP